MARAAGKTNLGMVFALNEELEAFERMLAQSHSLAKRDRRQTSWVVGNVLLNVALSGIGRKACAGATRVLIDNGAAFVICAGLAGGLAPEAKVGDVIIARRVSLLEDDDADVLSSDQRISATLPPSGTLGIAIRHCDLVTHDAVMSSSLDKMQAYSRTGAAALDMESYAAAQLCAQMAIPFAAIRAISDTADQSLPRGIEQMLSRPGKANKVLFAASHPSMIRPLLMLRRQSMLAANNLAEVLGIILLRLM